jgi:hypothetical protein
MKAKFLFETFYEQIGSGQLINRPTFISALFKAAGCTHEIATNKAIYADSDYRYKICNGSKPISIKIKRAFSNDEVDVEGLASYFATYLIKDEARHCSALLKTFGVAKDVVCDANVLASTLAIQFKAFIDEKDKGDVEDIFAKTYVLLVNDNKKTPSIIEDTEGTKNNLIGRHNSFDKIVIDDRSEPVISIQQTSDIDIKHFNFVFSIDINGKAMDFSSATKNAIREWFYDYAREDLSDCTDEDLGDTFDVEIVDYRILESEKRFAEINLKVKRDEELSVQDEHFYSVNKKQVNQLVRNNKIKKGALEFYLSDRTGQGVFNTLEHYELKDIVLDILNFPYGELRQLQSDEDMLDVFLNSNGNNKKHEQFLANIKTKHLEVLFGSSGVYDIYGRAFMDLGEYRKDIAPYFYIHLAELKLVDCFDFSSDKRVLSLLHYWIGIH